MTATINDLIDDSFADLPAPGACAAGDFAAPVLTVTVNDQAVLTIARRLHDGACLHGGGCGLRDFHAMDIYETDVRVMLAAMVQAGADGDGPEISPCRSVTERRWFRGQWSCAACGCGIRFGGGAGWVHTR
ncbi:hypothetical protein [Arthrobacter globiformis]|uniref:hypothetical protein n=1 Tax=Arthrobacter globiformis TaxID=1665 RepID=UPI00277F77CF|nr:hypothetical protein [Arthrobacter globiformis]MDQ0865411.1 hypothetical protein [Arthrobacter globiformis]